MNQALDPCVIQASLKQAVAAHGGSLRSIAADAGCSHSVLSTFLSGKREWIDLATLGKLATVLDRSVGQLIGEASGSAGTSYRMIALDDIDVDRTMNPRKHFDEEDIKELAASIASNGLLQPLVVRQNPHNSRFYVLIAGERRLRALEELWEQDALPGDLIGPDGATVAPCIVRSLSDEGDANGIKQEQLKLAIIENLQRVDLNAIEEAKAFDQLASMAEWDNGAIAQAIGKTIRYVQQRRRLLNLAPEIQAAVEGGRLSVAYAREIASRADYAEQGSWAERAQAGEFATSGALADAMRREQTLRQGDASALAPETSADTPSGALAMLAEAMPEAEADRIAYALRLLTAYDEATHAGLADLRQAIETRIEQIAIAMNGGDHVDMTAEGGGMERLEKAVALPEGEAPTWGRPADFILTVRDLQVRIDYEGVFGWICQGGHSFDALVTEWETPFISETGYYGFTAPSPSPEPGETPSQWLVRVIEQHIDGELQGELPIAHEDWMERQRRRDQEERRKANAVRETQARPTVNHDDTVALLQEIAEVDVSCVGDRQLKDWKARAKALVGDTLEGESDA